jgi:hypothetical protein
MSRCTRFGLLAVFLGACTLTVAGCSSSAQGSRAVGGTPTASGSAQTAAAPTAAVSSSSGDLNVPGTSGPYAAQKQAALFAYEEMVNDWVSAGLTANYKDPVLSQYASGDALELITKALITEQSKGAVSKGSPTVTDISFGQMVPSSDPTEIVINSCFSDAAWLEYKASDGSLLNNVPGGEHRTQVLAKDENGTWKIDQLAMNAVGTC